MSTIKTTIRGAIEQVLLLKLKEVTGKLRDKNEKKEKKKQFSREKIIEVHNIFKAGGWSEASLDSMLKVLGVLFDAPELGLGLKLPAEVFAVFVLSSTDGNKHAYPLNFPLICTEKNGPYMLHSDGGAGHCPAGIGSNPRYATDDEIEQCVKNLSANQWRTIMTTDLFKPIIDQAMNSDVHIEATESSSQEDGEEIVLANGRSIQT